MMSRLFQLGGITIYSYGLMVAIGFIIGIYFGVRRARLLGENPQNILDMCLTIMIASIAGARLCYVLTNIDYYRDHIIEIFFLQKGGLVFYGGVLSAVIASLIFLKIKKLNIWLYFDILSPSLAIGHALGRVGCFLNGCCYGRIIKADSLKWLGVEFPRTTETVHLSNGSITSDIVGAPAYLDHLNHGWIDNASTHCLPVYPTQLISAVVNLSVFFCLLYIFRKRSFNGQVWWSYTMIYAMSRFCIEFLRGDNPPVPPFFLTFSQTMAIVLFIIGAVMYILLRNRQQLPRPK
ncbi:MAG: prolipoprotein diacylglyceryl transferase [Candidatus Auribacterota bacterium]